MSLTKLSKEIHQINKDKGFWEKPNEIGTLLALVHSEVSEALEADREDRFANVGLYYEEINSHDINSTEEQKIHYRKGAFENQIKHHFEDELADIIIRVLDICASKDIDIEWFIHRKIEYNKQRPYKHGKKY